MSCGNKTNKYNPDKFGTDAAGGRSPNDNIGETLYSTFAKKEMIFWLNLVSIVIALIALYKK